MLDQIEEAKIAELKEKCRGLKMPAPPEIMIGLQVRDKDGKLTFDDIQRGHSWNRNFYNYLFGVAAHSAGDGLATFGAGYMSAKNIAGSIGSATTQSPINSYQISGGYGYTGSASSSSDGGILVGTGDTVFSVEQFGLVTPIVHGAGAGQLAFQAGTQLDPAYTVGTKTWKLTLSRIFNNNSGGLITVKEVGLAKAINDSMYGASAPILVERSVLAPTVAVAAAAQLTVTYEISMDFSAID